MKSFFERNRGPITSTITSIASIFLALIANQLYTYFHRSVDNDSEIGVKAFLFFSILFFTILGIFCVAKVSEHLKSVIWTEYKDDQYMKHAFLKIRQLGANRQMIFHRLKTSQNISEQKDATDFLIQITMDNMQSVVESCYDFFESAFTKTGQLQEPIKFEATFMTKSYLDGEITIPCSANKEKRTPSSMLLRKQNIKIFENTETASIYKSPNPIMKLIENTEKDSNYAETYDGQKTRIKSTVILPIKSHENALLGTLVVHCNRVNFFKMSRYAFWTELLELFSVELGYHKLVLDYLIEYNSDAARPF